VSVPAPEHGKQRKSPRAHEEGFLKELPGEKGDTAHDAPGQSQEIPCQAGNMVEFLHEQREKANPEGCSSNGTQEGKIMVPAVGKRDEADLGTNQSQNGPEKKEKRTHLFGKR
jgi:hypothetical protein